MPRRGRLPVVQEEEEAEPEYAAEPLKAPPQRPGRRRSRPRREAGSAADEAAGIRGTDRGAHPAAPPAGPPGAGLPGRARLPEPEPAPLAFDVGAHDVEFLAQVLECLMTKAFCVIDARDLDAASQPGAWRLTTDGFLPPPCAPGASLTDGLLGRDGSALVRPLELQAIGGLDTEDEDIDKLLSLTEDLQGLGQALAVELLGLQDAGATAPLLHLSEVRGGAAAQAAAPRLLSDELGSEWLQVFCRHRLMVIFFLGPGTGTLELGLYDDEALGVQRIATGSGVMVVLRPEVLARCHYADSDEPCLALTFFLLTLRGGRGPSEPPLPPYAEALVEWMEGRLRRTGQLSGEGHLDFIPSTAAFAPQAGPEEPGVFSMDRPEKQARVLADACKLPSSWSSEAFFEGAAVGADLVTEIPFMRFDYREHMDMLQTFDAMGSVGTGPETLCKHGSFIEGVDLFDNLCFGVSGDEVRSLPPSVRSGLEVAHEAICKAEGSNAKTALENPRINADVLVGMNSEDNELLRLSPTAGALKARGCAGCGAGRADEANRLSFALGLGGRSSLFDTDGSSSFAALWQGYLDQTKEHGDRDDPVFTLVLSSAWNLEPLCFSSFCRRGLLSPVGRCFCFDISASGFVRAEGCVGVILARGSSFATLSFDDGMDVGGIRGVSIRQSGSASRLGEPAGISMQQVMDEAVQAASASLTDVNILEAHAPGAQLFDAMEMGAAERVFPRFMDDETLPVTDVKTVLGNGYAAGGLFALLKVLRGTQRATLGGNSLLKTLNRDIRLRKEDCNLSFLTEALRHPVGSTGLTCINSFGTRGTYVSAIVWADLTRSIPEAPFFPEDEMAVEPPPAVSFWPAGGGELDPAEKPRDGYYIVGSFSRWTDPLLMEEEAPGEFTATIVLGYNRWEQFQIWLDGDPTRALHPGQLKASRKRAVFGPEPWEQCEMFRWQVEGRQRKTLTREEGAGDDGIPFMDDVENEDAGWKWVDVPTRDAGEPGTRYKVFLRIAGKYRTVDWERLPDEPGWEESDPVLLSKAMAAIVDASSRPATYYVKANWNDWTCEEMSQDQTDPNIWRLRVFLPYTNGVFTIVRNRDPEQYFYPEYDDEVNPTKPVLGPDDGNVGRCWMICEALGATLHIEFRREVGYRTDKRRLRWWVEGQEEQMVPEPDGGGAVSSTAPAPSAAPERPPSAGPLLGGPTPARQPLGPAALPEELAAAGSAEADSAEAPEEDSAEAPEEDSAEAPEEDSAEAEAAANLAFDHDRGGCEGMLAAAEIEEAPRPDSVGGLYVGPLTGEDEEPPTEDIADWAPSDCPAVASTHPAEPSPRGAPHEGRRPPRARPRPPPRGAPAAARAHGAPSSPEMRGHPAGPLLLGMPAAAAPAPPSAPGASASPRRRGSPRPLPQRPSEPVGAARVSGAEGPEPVVGPEPAEFAGRPLGPVEHAAFVEPELFGFAEFAEGASRSSSSAGDLGVHQELAAPLDDPLLGSGGVALAEPNGPQWFELAEGDESELPSPRGLYLGPIVDPDWDAEPAIRRVEARDPDP